MVKREKTKVNILIYAMLLFLSYIKSLATLGLP